jgi:hypothetical protein
MNISWSKLTLLVLHLVLFSTINAQAPTLVSITSNKVKIKYHNAINPSSANSANLKILGDETGLRTGTYTTSVDTVIFTPTTPFRAGELLHITSTGGLQYNAGPYATPFSWVRQSFVSNPTLIVFDTIATGIILPASSFGSNAGYQCTMADVNRDGRQDLIYRYNIGGGATNIRVYIRNSNGSFATPVTYTNTESYSTLIGTPDLNNDGYPDLVITHNVPARIQVRLNNGAGGFGAATLYVVNDYTSNANVYDLDRDGDLDIVVYSGNSDPGQNAINVLKNNGDGTFAAATTLTTGVAYSGGIPADINNDGIFELLYTSDPYVTSNPVFRVYTNDGNANFAQYSSEANPSVKSIRSAFDFDGNQTPDIITRNPNAEIYLTNSGLTYTLNTPTVLDAQDSWMLAGDLDGDGDLDIMSTNRYNGSNWNTLPMKFHLNNGNGTFVTTTSTMVLPQISPIDLTDYDSDGDLDHIYLNPATGEIKVLLNNCSIVRTLTLSDSPLSGTYQAAELIHVNGNVSVLPNGNVLLKAPLVKVSEQLDLGNLSNVTISPDGCMITLPPAGIIATLNCAGATNNGTLTSGTSASGVSSIVPYTGGNGGTHSGQTVSSTGVTGLTATLAAGSFASGSGSLTYTITGTPASAGTASFALNIGGQSCTLNRTVNLPAGTIATLNCAGATNNGTLTAGTSASGVSSIVPYTGGNGGTHNGQTVTSTGVTGLTATLTAGTFASGSGSLTYTITGTPASSGTASFTLNIGGQSCTINRTVNLPVGSIATLNCAGATNSGTLTAGTSVSGVSSIVPYTGGNGGTHNGQTVTSTGVTGLTATLTAGTFASGSESLTYTITGSPASSGTASFALNIGGQSCTLTRTVNLPAGTIATLNCAGATITGTLTSGLAASGISAAVPYTGGNGGTHNGQTVTSIGVTGLSATLAVGTFANGSGSLTYSITGTPSAAGTASFALNIGGQSCSLSVTVGSGGFTCGTSTVTFTYNGSQVTYGTVVSAGRCWLNRNLGASQVATSSTDAAAYGDLFQWGRGADGHQIRTPLSGTTTTLSSTDNPGHGHFIITSGGNYDWRSPKNNNLWQGVNGVNNPCPSGFRVPTAAELDTERASWGSNQNAVGAFDSPLKLPLAGSRGSNGGIGGGSYFYYWYYTTENNNYGALYYTSPGSTWGEYLGLGYFLESSSGFSIRCIKDDDPLGSINSLHCSSTYIKGGLNIGIPTKNVSYSIPYEGGNGGSFNSQSITSSGVLGLTAYLYPGVLANGNGILTYIISGTPTSTGTATFNIDIFGQTCSIIVPVSDCGTSTVSFNYNGSPVTYGTVVSAGKCWLDRNLGASQVATSSTDAAAYGDLFQWGRGADGHQIRTSGTTSTLSGTDNPGHGNFIRALNSPYDWRSPGNSNLWQGLYGINNPCPNGFRVPTSLEMREEFDSWSIPSNAVGNFSSPLKLPIPGFRLENSQLSGVGTTRYYYTSDRAEFPNANYALANGPNLYIVRAYGASVRCTKEENVGSIGNFECSQVIMSGTLNIGAQSTGVSAEIPYLGGNGGSHPGQTVSSTGVQGITAFTHSGLLAIGNGTLKYTFSGIPASTGIANFALNIGGQTCNLMIEVGNCGSYSVTFTYNGNPVTYGTSVSNGRCWLDRNLGASQVATSSTHSVAYGDLFQWGRIADGHQIRTSGTTSILSNMDNPGHGNFIVNTSGSLDWRSPQNNELWQGEFGINNPCPSGFRLPTENELNSERLSWILNNSGGAFNSPLKLTRAGLRNNNGSLNGVGTSGGYCGTTNDGQNARYLNFSNSNALISSSNRATGLSIRCIRDESPAGSIGSLNCGGATISGIAFAGIATPSLTAIVDYTVGNGGSHSGQTVNSTGVTGLTAFLYPGIFSNGSGSLTYTITGTPLGSGTAIFLLNIGGQTCSINVNVGTCGAPETFSYNGNLVTYGTVVSAGRCWLDRNLGASQVATSSTDALAYGDLFQWGRGADGHQRRSPLSSTTQTSSTTDSPGHGNFITTTGGNYDWRFPQNENLWQGTNGINNPCPEGFRLPTTNEFEVERLSWSNYTSIGAYASPLKLPVNGYRRGTDGSVYNSIGLYWSGSVDGSYSRCLYFDNGYSDLEFFNRADGQSVRCIKN